MRKADHDELSAVMNCAPDDDVMKGYEDSENKWIIFDVEGTINIPVALFGVQRFNEKTGVPWMVATNDISKIKRFLVENTKKYIDIMKKDFDLLVNFVDVRNTVSIEWLKRAGFQFDEPAPYGVNGLLFHRFYMECKV
jgi:hypothetical protein